MRDAPSAEPAILFWFYRDVEVCENRLLLLRRFNPTARIFGLYGGPPEKAGEFERRLGGLLDDFYSYDGSGDAAWKWINGDLVIRAWFTARGRDLEWRSIVVVQWDMLALGPLARLVGAPAEDEVILSGLRPVAEVEEWWPWVRGDSRATFEAFMRHLGIGDRMTEQAWCCQFVFVCLGRAFLEEYARVDEPELGFIEYRVPTYAHRFGMRLSAPRLPCWWEGDPEMATLPERSRTLSARRRTVETHHVLGAWISRGSVVVHPYRQPFPVDARSAAGFLTRGLLRRVKQALHVPRAAVRDE